MKLFRQPKEGWFRPMSATTATIAACACLLVTVGCQTRNPVFPEPSPPITWPKGDFQARLKYVGTLTKAADLKPGRSLMNRLGDLIFGKDTPAPLYGPRDVLVIGQTVWVADPGGRCLHMFDVDTRNYKKISEVGSDHDAVHLHSPVGLCKGPDETFFICDSVNAEIYQFKYDGTFVRTLGNLGDLDRPTALCYVAETKKLYVLDTKSHDIKVFDSEDRLTKVIGKRGEQPGEFNFPVDIDYSDKHLWVVDAGNGRVQALTTNGKPVMSIGRFGKNPGDFALPKSVAMDSAKNVYVTDSRFENIQIFDRRGQLLMHLGGEGAGPGEFSLPSGIFIDDQNRIWVCDSYNNRLQVFQLIKEVSHVKE